MTEFQEQLDIYAFPESVIQTETYLKKYWLTEKEYEGEWKIKLKQIFSNTILPEKLLSKEFEWKFKVGGLLLDESEFEKLKSCIRRTGDSNFVIIENYNYKDPPYSFLPGGGKIVLPPLRFVYPANISWTELNISDGICYELFQVPSRNLYIYGNSGDWAQYIANDSHFPFKIIGYKKKYAQIFEDVYKVSDAETAILREKLPGFFRTEIE